jgi:hypothetical protein
MTIARCYPYLYVDSPFVSKWYPWFCELGYPQLDIAAWDDGEWAILQMANAPLMPAMTKFNYILTGLRNIEKSRSFVKEYVELLDLTKSAYWALEEEKSQQAEEEADKKEKHMEESTNRKLEVIKRCPTLMERVHKFGLNQIGFESIWRNLTPEQKRRMGNVNRQLFATS